MGVRAGLLLLPPCQISHVYINDAPRKVVVAGCSVAPACAAHAVAAASAF